MIFYRNNGFDNESTLRTSLAVVENCFFASLSLNARRLFDACSDPRFLK